MRCEVYYVMFCFGTITKSETIITFLRGRGGPLLLVCSDALAGNTISKGCETERERERER